MSITAMKKAREGLKAARHGHCDHAWASSAIADLDAAIEAAEKREPVGFDAWFDAEFEKVNGFVSTGDPMFYDQMLLCKAWALKAWRKATPPAAPVPEGWKMVPVNPTPEMLAAADQGDREYTLRNFGDIQTVMQGPEDHYAAMLDAAPAQPAPVQFKCTVVDDQHPNGIPLEQWGNPPAQPAQRQPLTDERVDAQRYRLLRRGQHWSVINVVGDVLRADALDAEIDKAHGITGEKT